MKRASSPEVPGSTAVKNLVFSVMVAAAITISPAGLSAQEPAAADREDKEAHHDPAAELGHKQHPVHAAFESNLSGWLTAIAQGTIGSKDAAGEKNDASEGSLSMDIFYEAALNGSGLFLFHLDAARGGDGLSHIPALLASPNGNPTGTNADLEFDEDRIHVVEASYETTLGDGKWTLTFGHIDPTGYFDANAYANDERTQFLANGFVINPAIEWGGDPNFFGPGARLTFTPSDLMDVTFGVMEGDGDYRDMFSRPFMMAEVDLKPNLGGKEGTYRIYYWENHLPHYDDFLTVNGGTATAPDPISGEEVPTGALLGDKNTGFGISLDQVLTDNFGIWARLGMQDGDVSQFDRHVSAGVQIAGGAFGRPDDAAGVGLGMTMVSDAYKDALGFSDNELYAEAYYNMLVKEGFQVSPDIQYVSNPGGDGSQDPFFVYGVRAGVMF